MNVKISSIFVVVLAAFGCSLELSDKLACNTDDDCLGSRVCVSGTCRAASDEMAGDILGPGDASAGEPRYGTGSKAGDPRSGDGVGQGGVEPDSAGLVALVPSNGVLAPAFSPAITDYTLLLSSVASELSLTPDITRGAKVTLHDELLVSGVASSPIALSADSDRLQLAVHMGESKPKTYTVSVERSRDVRGELLKPAMDPGGAIFGTTVALHGDTLAVANLQAVDVFRDTGSGFELEQHLVADGGRSDDSFGESLALEGDRLIVGASREDSGALGVDGDRDNDDAPESGAAYVYVRDNGVWREEAYLKASNARSGDGFGTSVALHGNVIAVGAPMESGNAIGVNGDEQKRDGLPHSGAVYLFELGDSGWQQTTYVKTAQDVPGNHLAAFGWLVELADDLLVVSASNEDVTWFTGPPEPGSDGPLSAGAVYILSRKHGVWQHAQRLQASNAEINDGFGLGLALAGGLLAVGAPNEDGSTSGLNGDQLDNAMQNSGAVYLFERTEQGFEQRAYLKPHDPRLGGQFGSSLALRGATLAVGEWAEGRRDGGAYLFGLVGGRWSEHLRLDAETARGNMPDDAMADTFGWSLALSERALIVGAPYERPFDDEVGIGATYAFR